MLFRYSVLSLITGAVLMSAPQSSAVSPTSGNREDASAAIGMNMTYEPVNSGDLLYVYVADYPEITRSYRISQDGTISIPALKDPLAVSGLTPPAVERTLAHALVDAKLLIKPVVSVAALEYRSRPVQISGAVKHPITIQALGAMRLLDALAKSDGLDSDAGTEIVILRPNTAEGASEMHIPVQSLFDGSDPLLNVPLHGGEQIRVPRAGKLYIVGNVKNPGVYPFTEADGLSVLKAVGLCQGLLPYSYKEALVYRQVEASDHRVVITIPVSDILKQRAPDVALQANDILYVPDHSGRRAAAAALGKLTGAGSTAATIALWRSLP